MPVVAKHIDKLLIRHQLDRNHTVDQIDQLPTERTLLACGLANQVKFLGVMLFTPHVDQLLCQEFFLNPTDEEGKAHIIRVICTDSGQCLIFYYRSKSVSDMGSINGPYMKACQLTPSGEFTNLSSSILLNASATIMNSIDIHEIQENDESIRLIGLDGKILYEIWWFKNNNTAIVRERNFGKTFAYGVFSRRSQWPYMNGKMEYVDILLGFLFVITLIFLNISRIFI